MTLQSGTRLGAYEIIGPIGAGGMGEVYKARDTRLGRSVAVKILPADLTSDPLARQRFEREARTVAALSHPHICPLFDVGRHEDTDFLIVEYLEGETLEACLAKGRLPLDRALEYAIQIADALAAAHKAGIIHRDLKPGNIMLTNSGAKLLDFGLAKPRKQPVVSGQTAITGGEPLTTYGTILGTLQYMAPEQLQGGEADPRGDIFAFGCVLYEMLTGTRAFGGDSSAHVIAAIMNDTPPPVGDMQSSVGPALDHIVRRTLAKQPDDRFQSSRDLLLELKWAAEERTRPSRPRAVAATLRMYLLGALLVIAVLAALALAARHFLQSAGAELSTNFDVLLPDNLMFETSYDAPIISPDGRVVLFSATSAGTRHLWLRPLDSRTLTMVQGTAGASAPFWSFDSRSIGFFAAGKLKRVSAAGGPVATICDSEATLYSSGSWNQDGVILFAGAPGPIYRVSEDGGAPQAATRLTADERDHILPVFLPDGRRFLYVVSGLHPGVYAGSLDGPEAKEMLTDAVMASYAEPGYLLFSKGQTLFAQQFDRRRLRLRDKAASIADGVFFGRFSVSRNGVLAYRPQNVYGFSRFVWIDRDGRRLGVVGDPGRYVQMALSPTGRKLAIQRSEEGPNHDLWLLDLTTNVLSRLTSDPEFDVDPAWSPDERRIAFASRRSGVFTLFDKDLLTGKEEQLLADPPQPGVLVDDWSPDGRFVVIRTLGRALYTFSMEDKHVTRLTPDTPYTMDQSHVSPDGKWIAFHSNESGRFEVYLAAFPTLSDKRQVSAAGGLQPEWSSDGRELFYLELDGRLMAVPVRQNLGLEVGTPSVLFQTNIRPTHVSQYAVAPGAKRFLLLEPERPGGDPVTLMLDWTARLAAR
jgi:eukaryotic-like serine/threonine-protein kinase